MSAGPTISRPSLARERTAERTAILAALGRCLRGQRHSTLTQAMSIWRLSLSHILRHQSLMRLQAQSQAQQQSLAALRRSLPASAPPRPGHPSSGGGTATPAQQQATQQGSSLLRDALLARLVRSAKLLCVCSALGRWRHAALAMTTDGSAAASANAAGRGHGPGGISATAPRALKRASAQEATIYSLREKLSAAEAELAEKGRLIALTTKQLATADSRRRATQAAGKSAQERLSQVQLDIGRSHARDEELQTLREQEVEWLGEAGRLAAERQLMAAELGIEEKGAVHARELVVACHAELLRQQREQQRAAEALSANWRKGLQRSAAQQSAMASDVRALGNMLARATAQRKAEATAKRRALQAGTPVTQAETAATRRRAFAGGNPVGGTPGFNTPAPHAAGGGDARQRQQLTRAGGLSSAMQAAIAEIESDYDQVGDDEADEEQAHAEARIEAEAAGAERDGFGADKNAASEAGRDRFSPVLEEQDEEQGGEVGAAAADDATAAMAAATPATVMPSSAVAARTSVNAPPSSLAKRKPPLTFNEAVSRAAELDASLTASLSAGRSAALRRVVRSKVERRLLLGWSMWHGAHAACMADESIEMAVAPLVAARDEARIEAERLRMQLVDARTKLAEARDALSKAKTSAHHSTLAKELNLKVQMLQRRLHAEQAARSAETKRRDASSARYAAALAAASPHLAAAPKAAKAPQPRSPTMAKPQAQTQASQQQPQQMPQQQPQQMPQQQQQQQQQQMRGPPLSLSAPQPQPAPSRDSLSPASGQPRTAWAESYTSTSTSGAGTSRAEGSGQVTSTAFAQVAVETPDVGALAHAVHMRVYEANASAADAEEDDDVAVGRSTISSLSAGLWTHSLHEAMRASSDRRASNESAGEPACEQLVRDATSTATPAYATPGLVAPAASPPLAPTPVAMPPSGHPGSALGSTAVYPGAAGGNVGARTTTSARILAARARAAAVLAGADTGEQSYPG